MFLPYNSTPCLGDVTISTGSGKFTTPQDSRKTPVAERKNFKLLFSAGIVLAVGVSNLYISSNEND